MKKYSPFAKFLLLIFVALIFMGATQDSCGSSFSSESNSQTIKQEILLNTANVNGFVVKTWKTGDWGYNKVVCIQIISSENGKEYLNQDGIVLSHEPTLLDVYIGENLYHALIVIHTSGVIDGKSTIKQNF